MHYDVSGRTVFITGAARGIGAESARRLHAKGANVALVTDAITYPNGLAFSDDGTTLYVASWDTTTLHALSFDVDRRVRRAHIRA